MFIRLLICALFSFQFLFSAAQNNSDADSLLTLFQQEQDWNTKAEIAYRFSKLKLGSDQEACLALYGEVEKNKDQISDTTQLFNLYNTVGIIFLYRHEIDTSNLLFSKAAQLALQIKDSSKWVMTQLNTAINLKNTGRFQQAIERNLEVLAFSRRERDTLKMASTSTEIGSCYIYMKNYIQGKKYQESAIELFKSINYYRGIGNAYNSIAYIYSEKGIVDSIVHYAQLALDAHVRSGNKYSMANAQQTLCGALVKGGNEKEIYACYADLLEYNEEIKNKEGIITARLNLARSLSRQQKHELAISYYMDLEPLLDEYDNKRLKLATVEGLKLVYQRQKNYEQALLYLDSARRLEAELMDLEIQEAVLEADKKFEVAEKQRELVTARNKIIETELEVASKTNLVILVGAGAGIVLLIVGFLFFLKQQRNKAMVAQIKITEQKKSINAVLTAQEDERRRIARELHDGVGQSMSAVIINQQAIPLANLTDEALTRIQKSSELLEKTRKEIREISHQMMPATLIEVGLAEAIGQMLEITFGVLGITYEFDNNIDTGKRYPEALEVGIYRVCQELVQNVLKHAEPDHVNINLYERNDNLHLLIEDDGKGFKPKESDSGIGITNLKTRLDMLGGNINIESEQERGTLAIIKIPLK